MRVNGWTGAARTIKWRGKLDKLPVLVALHDKKFYAPPIDRLTGVEYDIDVDGGEGGEGFLRHVHVVARPDGTTEELATAAADVDEELATAAADVDEELAGAAADVDEELAGAAADVDEGLVTAAADVDEELATAAADVDEELAGAAADVDEELAGAAADVDEGLVTAAADVDEELATAPADVDEELAGAAADVDEGLVTAAADVDEGLAGAAADVDEGLVTAAADVDEELAGAATDVDEELATAATDVDEELAGAAADVDEELAGAAADVDEELVTAAADVDEELVTAAEDLAPGIEVLPDGSVLDFGGSSYPSKLGTHFIVGKDGRIVLPTGIHDFRQKLDDHLLPQTLQGSVGIQLAVADGRFEEPEPKLSARWQDIQPAIMKVVRESLLTFQEIREVIVPRIDANSHRALDAFLKAWDKLKRAGRLKIDRASGGKRYMAA